MQKSKRAKVSTPSRICLMGEHQDYLGLEVIAQAINLRFNAKGKLRNDGLIKLKMKGENIELFEVIDLKKKIVYKNQRDYIKSTINILRKYNYDISSGFDISMESEIPIGKGMCSSSAMIIVFIKIILELIDSPDKDDADKIAYMGYDAEVLEFKEPGGMMDHYTSVYGGLLHIDCASANVDVEKIDFKIPGKFILFDSLEEKNTVVVLANAKNPVVEGMEKLKEHSVSNIKDLINNQEEYKKLDLLDEDIARKIKCQIDNYIAQRQAYEMLNDDFDMVEFGALIKRHHNNLRDGLNISTPKIEEILNTAYKVGALGGKLNGSGGGGCCYVYVKDEDIQNVLDAVASLGLGYKGFILESDEGMRAE